MQERLCTDMYAAARSIKKSKVLTVHGTADLVNTERFRGGGGLLRMQLKGAF